MNFKSFFIFFILFHSSLFSDPWGKDADLCFKKKQVCHESRCQTPVFGAIAETLIGFHKNVITPIDGPRSHYLPSSSQYTLDAMRKYGYFKGFTLGCDRLLRENEDEWVYPKIIDQHGFTMKSDPVK